MNIEDFPKFQYSIFTQGREAQYVIRAVTIEELSKAKSDLEAFMNGLTPPAITMPLESPTISVEPPASQNTLPRPPASPDEPTCPIHGIVMRKRYRRGDSEELGSVYWYDHRMKHPEGHWETCSGKGWRMQKR